MGYLDRSSIIACLSIKDDIKFKHSFTYTLDLAVQASRRSIYGYCRTSTLCTERDFDDGVIRCYSEKTAVPSRDSTAEQKRNF